MKKILKKLFFAGVTASLIFCCNIYAKDLNIYEYTTQEVVRDTGKMVNLTTYTFCKPASSMDFVDEDGYFNNIYVSENNVYWSRYDDSMKQISTKTIPLFYNKNTEEKIGTTERVLTYNFGNAVYHNGYLYVMYSRYSSRNLSVEEYKNENVMAMVKYDKNGNAVCTKEYKTVELTNSYSADDISYSTSSPFYTSNCSLAVNDGVIACFYGRNIRISHQTSALMFIDLDTLEIVSNLQNRDLSTVNRRKYYIPYGHCISHSLGQRIISTSDGQFLMMESGDAGSRGNTRGLMLTKLYEKYDEELNQNVIKETTKKMVHYSEGSTGNWGYNCTYSVLGNIIELNDGYMYIGGLDKNINLAYGSGLDSPWNVFVQKYNKNFYDMENQEEMQLLRNVTIRGVIGTKPTDTTLGRLYLNGDEKDYGLKWLTDLDDTRTVILVRAIKIKYDNVVVLWEEDQMNKSDYGGYYLSSSSKKSHYMIIDKDGNIVVEDTILDDALISDAEQYVYKDGRIYWTTADGISNKITVNTLEVDEKIKVDFQKGDLNRDGKVNAADATKALEIFKNESATEEDLEIGDMDGRNGINANDATMILEVFKNSNIN